MEQKQIKAKALGIFQHDGKLLVFEGYDPVKDETFYRPLGGGIEFGETGAQAMAREIREELGAEVTKVRYLGVSENIFIGDGKDGHEIVLLYAAELIDAALYEQAEFEVVEPSDATFRAVWMPLSDFADGRTPLYPEGLIAILGGASHAP